MSVVTTRKDNGVLVVSVNNPPVNALSKAVRVGLMAAVEQAARDPDVRAVVLRCEGRTFHAGADITEFGTPAVTETPLRELIAAIEASPKPFVAALHGTAFGGGLELALGCNYRIGAPSAKMGLPEVKLGILPGGGGTQRLPRVIGVEAALPMIVNGDPIGASEALALGLLDRVAGEATLEADAVAFAGEIADRSEHPVVSRRTDKIAEAVRDPGVFDRFRQQHAKRLRTFEAPEACLQCVKAAVELPFEEGLKRERELFLGLVSGSQSKALRHIFFAERAASKLEGVPADTPVIPIKKVGVLGAGTMGGGIAMNFLSVGVPVTLVEREQGPLDRGVSTIRTNYLNTVKKGRLTEAQVEAAMGLLTPSLDINAFGDCDLVIEAVFENMELKKEVFRALDGVLKPGAILASNTSYLNIDELAAETSRPDHVLGLHFFSPANVMRLLEIVRGEKTAPHVLKTAMALSKKIAKIAVVAGVCHGFIGNRMLSPRQREAQKLILEGAKPWQVDRVLTDFGFPMGPFQMSDLAGLDIGWSAETSKSETVREVLCERGRRGQKTGKGYYDYDESRRGYPSPEVEEIIARFSAGIPQREISDQEILERLLYPMINEGAKILEEGKAQRASDIDIVWLNGYGWPATTGGPMFWADTIGLDKVVAGLKKYGFEPASMLERKAASGERFNS